MRSNEYSILLDCTLTAAAQVHVRADTEDEAREIARVYVVGSGYFSSVSLAPEGPIIEASLDEGEVAEATVSHVLLL